MTKIYYGGEDKVISSEPVDPDYRLSIFTNKAYFTIPMGKRSRFDGFFVKQQDFFKILDSIEFEGLDFHPDKVVVIGNSFTTYFGFISNSFYIDSDTGSLLYESNSSLTMKLYFDVKRMFDDREWGRIYDFKMIKDNLCLIHFVKKTDEKEDPDSGRKEFEKYVFIKFNGSCKRTDSWKHRKYDYDAERNSPITERYVFNAVELKANRFMILVSDNFEQGYNQINARFKVFDKIVKDEIAFNLNRVCRFEEVNFAYSRAQHSLLSLATHDYLMAGLPWFYQEWARDEALSLKALVLSGELNKARKYMENLMKNVYYNGKIYSNLSEKGIFSIDALPWLFHSIAFLVRFAEKENLSAYLFSRKFIKEFETTLLRVLDLIDKYFVKGDLIYADKQETWMDSSFGKDVREGFLLEVQAMYMYLHRLAYALTGKEYYRDMENKMRIATVNNFYDGNLLYDDLNNRFFRPNVFIAYYFYPEMLSYLQWRNVFDEAIKRLWMPWGGFATIDKKSELFCSKHTGEDVRSYHRGDSWYFLNNLAAIAMYRLDKSRYANYIADIIAASTKEILWLNSLGVAGELSSAGKQTSQGAFNQAWSNATFIEMINELMKDL